MAAVCVRLSLLAAVSVHGLINIYLCLLNLMVVVQISVCSYSTCVCVFSHDTMREKDQLF